MSKKKIPLVSIIMGSQSDWEFVKPASNILKDIFSKKLTKAKEGIAKSLRTKSFKAIEDYKNSFKFELPTKYAPTPEVAPTPEPIEADK